MTCPRKITVSGELASCFRILKSAHEFAIDAEMCAWQFALEIEQLLQTGTTICGIRWLVAKGFVKHAQEITLAGDGQREFRNVHGLIILPTSCFVITESGLRVASELKCEDAKPKELENRPQNGNRVEYLDLLLREEAPNYERKSELKPVWDTNRKELRYAEYLVKIFKWPANNQELILSVFEEEGWPPRIDDPLPVAPDQVPKRRLHDTIKCLNRSQKNSLIRFRGDGTGEGVLWEAADDSDTVLHSRPLSSDEIDR